MDTGVKAIDPPNQTLIIYKFFSDLPDGCFTWCTRLFTQFLLR